MFDDPDRLIASTARTQLGAFSRPDAIRVGFTTRMIGTRVQRGEWNQMERDVFALACFPTTWQQRCMAATLTHPAAALSHGTSAAMLGLDGFRPGGIHITVPPVADHESVLATVHRSRHHQFTNQGPLRVTTFAQTMVQLAGVVAEDRLRSALHSGVHASPGHLDRLQYRIAELRDRRLPGMRHLIALVDELDGNAPTASELERMLFDTIRHVPGIPPITRQAPMPWSPNRTTIVDGLIVPWNLIVEADGRAWHSRVEDFEVDRWRDAEAAAHGLHVMRFTWHRLTEDAAGVVDQLTRFAALRSRHAA